MTALLPKLAAVLQRKKCLCFFALTEPKKAEPQTKAGRKVNKGFIEKKNVLRWQAGLSEARLAEDSSTVHRRETKSIQDAASSQKTGRDWTLKHKEKTDVSKTPGKLDSQRG